MLVVLHTRHLAGRVGGADITELDVRVDDGGRRPAGLDVRWRTRAGGASTTSRTSIGGVDRVGGRVEPEHVCVVL